ncbi:MAG: hypothetical protein ACKESB_02885 [Candidatus Hodgkinia cicadicola]
MRERDFYWHLDAVSIIDIWKKKNGGGVEHGVSGGNGRREGARRGEGREKGEKRGEGEGTSGWVRRCKLLRRAPLEETQCVGLF